MDITGRLVRLRGLDEGDAEPIAAALASPEVTRHLAAWARLPYGVEDALRYIRERPAHTVRWAIEDLTDGALVGGTGLHGIDLRNRHCEWGIWIGPPDRWGRGLGTEACRLATAFAFDHLGMAKVCLHVYAPNQRGRRAYEKAGYQLEGTYRRHVWLDGQWVDVHLMACFPENLVRA